MQPTDFGEVLRQGARETVAADLGVDAVETAHPAGEPPTVIVYKANRAGYEHWEIRRITYPGGTPDYHEHRDRQAQGNWMGGLPEGLKKAHLVPMETGQDPATDPPEDTTHPTASLETACTTPEILEAVARFIQPTCSPEMIPDMETLATWVTNDCLSDARAAADTLLMATWGRRAAWLVSGNGEPDSPPRRLMAYVDRMLAGDGAPDNMAMVDLETVHSVWLDGGEEQPIHPLTPLVIMWQQRPEALRAETKHTRIMPKGLLDAAPSAIYVDEPLHDPSFLPMTGYVEKPESSQLALFPATDTKSDLPPVTPLVLAGAAGFGALTLGRGARLDKRILIYSLLSMPLEQRRPGGRYEWRPTLRELIELLWAKDAWRPNKHAKALEAAFDAVTLAKIRLPDGRTWRPVVARGMPNPYDLDSRAVIQLEVPDLSDRGPSLDFPGLVADGRISDPAFDLWLSLAYLWDAAKARNGGFRVYATRPKARRDAQGYLVDAEGNLIVGHPDNPFMKDGKLSWKPGNAPQRDWRHPRAVLEGKERHPQADKVPALPPEARRQLAYGLKQQPDKAHRIRERNKADALLQRLEAAGRVVIERDDKLWRILEPNPRAGPPVR